MTYRHAWTRDQTAAESKTDLDDSGMLPGAVRALNDHELRVLLIALLQEWRGRTALRGDPL
jgi:hypothetical protein